MISYYLSFVLVAAQHFYDAFMLDFAEDLDFLVQPSLLNRFD